MWTTEQILSFSPDAGIAQRGQDLATTRKWRNLQGNENAIWGECKSSGASFYFSAIDLQNIAFKCNCPSRKFPCKHTMGLMLLFANNSDAFQVVADLPSWVEEWLEKRKNKITEPKGEADELAAQQKREEQKTKTRSKRMIQMEAGVEDLEMWLTDTIRQGLASTERKGYDFWHDISARMVDAKLGGIGKRIKSMQLLQGGNINWVDKMLSQMTDLYMVAKGFKNLENLPLVLQQELLAVAGINIRKEEVLMQEEVKDEWVVMGQIEGVEDNLNFRRVWLFGKKTKRNALILDFVFGGGGFPNHFPTGSLLKAGLHFYPSASPLRAVVNLPFEISNTPQLLTGFADFKKFAIAYSKVLFANPWLLDYPVCFENVIPVRKKNLFFILDKNKKQLEVLDRNEIGWKLLALSGGYPIKIFGEWTGDIFIPMSAEAEGRLVEL
ncbi:MAG TPA: hypothetical protein ENJ53_04055 [Phaeodactylibacter sp.]|nr:hypothetical protein [Phaeodactylibacter sp.]